MSGAADSGLMHRFVQGLSFDTRLRYQAIGARGKRMLADLPQPWPAPVSEGDSGQLCLLQAALMRAQARPSAAVGALPALTDARQVEQWCARFGGAIHVRINAASSRPRALGLVIDDAIRRGGVCSLQLEMDGQRRWTLVAGTEIDGTDPALGVRALLLIDPDVHPPWGTGYNARIELQARLKPDDGAKGAARRYRSTHGRRCLVKPTALLVVESVKP